MAARLEDPDIQALTVVAEGRLRGIITRADLLRVALELGSAVSWCIWLPQRVQYSFVIPCEKVLQLTG
jgi:hypothetical protein